MKIEYHKNLFYNIFYIYLLFYEGVMPRKALVDKEKLQSDLLAYLRLHGVSSSQSLCIAFKISQPTLSRMLSLIKDKLLIIGKAQDTKYAVCRKIEGTATPISIYEIGEDGSSRLLGVLHALAPQGFYFEGKIQETKSAFFHDLPYFLNDLRPNGFLGRFIPPQNKDLNLPKDIRLWTTEHSLEYLTCRGWNNIGNIIIGEKSFQLYLENSKSFPHAIHQKKREEQYPLYANNIVAFGDPGSSAGGEQPKFITLLLPENQHVLVKFSPPVNTEIGERIADILICENIAHGVLKKNAQDTSDSEIFKYDNRIFLEVKRFDRINKLGRRGLISLGSLDAEFTAVLGTWSKASTELIARKILPQSFFEKIRWLELFGDLIANTDMHFYNLSFFTKGQKIIDLAPAYDMSPMLFMPRNNQIIPIKFNPSLPSPTDGKIWNSVCCAACEFWDNVLKDVRISNSFKEIALECKIKVTELKSMAKLLPKN